MGLRSFTITFRFLRYASQQNTPYPENGSITVSPGLEYLSIKGLIPEAGFLPQYLCIKYRGAVFFVTHILHQLYYINAKYAVLNKDTIKNNTIPYILSIKTLLY